MCKRDWQKISFLPIIAGDGHSIIPLATARTSLEAHFSEMIKKCSDKVTELCRLEKQTWQTVDKLNEKCEAMVKQVDTTAEKQVSTSTNGLHDKN